MTYKYDENTCMPMKKKNIVNYIHVQLVYGIYR